MVALAAAVLLGSLVARPIPGPLVVAGGAAGVLALRETGRRRYREPSSASWRVARPAAVTLLCAAVVASGLAARAWAGLGPVEPADVGGEITLVSDPVVAGEALLADVRWQGQRLLARFGAADRRVVAGAQAGDRLLMIGSTRPLAAGRPPTWAAARHLAGRLDVDRVVDRRPAGGLVGLANELRAVLARGTGSLDRTERTLFLGFVLGDDRAQLPETTDDFRAAGLGHLLAVSGQNVALLLALCRPLLERITFGPRTVCVLGLLVLFTLATRAEPSVLRASGMAAVVAVAAWRGSDLSPIRALSLTVTALVLVDPLLLQSLGFRLSVAATTGIALLAPAIEARVPGPSWVRSVAAVTTSAQIGVLPVALPAFGSTSLIALPANVLAEPAAALVNGWGLVAGLVAGIGVGIADGRLAAVLHVPTALLVRWVASVAGLAAQAPSTEVGPAACAALGVVLAGLFVLRRRRAVGRIGLALVVLLVASGVTTGASGAPRVAQLDDGVAVWAADANVLVVDGRPDVTVVVGGLRRLGVDRIDAVVLRSSGPAVIALLATLDRRYGTPARLAGPTTPLAGGTLVQRGEPVAVGSWVVSVDRRGQISVGVRSHEVGGTGAAPG